MAERRKRPPRNRKSAAEVAKQFKPGRMHKVIVLDEKGEKTGEVSRQLPADPFNAQYQPGGLVEPPHSMEQLVELAELHPTHSAILDQKAADVCGTGWEWEADDEDEDRGDNAHQAQRARLNDWFEELGKGPQSDETTYEVLSQAWNDLETVGHGCIELARDPQGKLRYWYSLPAHTTRFGRDGYRIAQIRNEKRVWFKRWMPGDEKAVDRRTGRLYDKRSQVPAGRVANEILVLRRPTRRSSWYGVPTYISATGWIALSIAARDDNILFFQNRREPRWAIILKNVQDDPDLEEQLRKALTVDMAQPHRNLIIPLSGPAEIEFQQLGDNKGDMSWEKLQDRADASILIGHRMPGERIGLVRVGALGGSVVEDTSTVYKEGFVETSQELLSSRINMLIENESEIGDPRWNWKPEELDLTDHDKEMDGWVMRFVNGVLKLNEARVKIGSEALEDSDERGDKFLWELSPQAAAIAQAAAASIGAGDQAAVQDANNRLANEVEALLRGNGTR